MSTFRFVDVSACRRFSLSTFWFVDVSDCRRFGLSTLWLVDVLVCRRFGLSTFRLVDVSVWRCFGLSKFWLSTFRFLRQMRLAVVRSKCYMFKVIAFNIVLSYPKFKCRRFDLLTLRLVDVLVCRRFGLSTFWFVDVSDCRSFGCRRFGFYDRCNVSAYRTYNRTPPNCYKISSTKEQRVILLLHFILSLWSQQTLKIKGTIFDSGVSWCDWVAG